MQVCIRKGVTVEWPCRHVQPVISNLKNWVSLLAGAVRPQTPGPATPADQAALAAGRIHFRACGCCAGEVIASFDT